MWNFSDYSFIISMTIHVHQELFVPNSPNSLHMLCVILHHVLLLLMLNHVQWSLSVGGRKETQHEKYSNKFLNMLFRKVLNQSV